MWRRSLLVVAAAVLALSGCGGGGGGGEGGGSSGPPADVAGVWTVTENLGPNTCGEPQGAQPPYEVTVSQNGNNVTVATDTPGVGPFSGTINGNTLRWTGSYPEDGGTTTITGMTLTVNGDTFSGSSNWSWTDGVDSCSGTTSVTGVRTT